jgi:trehalose 6-phosphate synthase
MSRLVVVSNRIAPPDEHAASAGGLAVGILGALKAAGGLWFGWSGETGNEDQPLKKVKKGNITWASFNLSEQDLDEYYNQFSNAVLWPAFHYRLDLVQFQRPAWDGYLRVNALLADKLLPLLQDDDIIWIHDYHLLPFAHELRKRGVNNRIGFFLQQTKDNQTRDGEPDWRRQTEPVGVTKGKEAFIFDTDRFTV